MLLLLLLLMMMKVANMQLSADIYSCSDETKSENLHFTEDTHIQICCQLTEKWCKATTLNDTLTLLPKHETGCNGSCDLHMHREDKCMVIFEISNASATDEGKYVCKLNGEKLMTGEVFIIKKPPTPVITSFSCSFKNERTVTFDLGPPSTEYNDSYNVTMIESNNKYVMCNTTQAVCKSGDRICTCNLTVPGILYASRYVTICVTVVRSVQTSETCKNFSIAGHFIPAPVMRLSSSDVGPSSASIKFCMDQSTSNLCGFMALNKADLRFNLHVSKKQGTLEILNVNLPSTTNENSICELKCMLVKLTNLTAFTSYTVLVSSCGGGGESQKSVLTFITAQTVPVYPPLVDAIGFRRLESYNVSGLLLPGLVLMWKPLPHEAAGARELSYRIEITSENDFQDTQTTADAHAIYLRKDFPPGPISVKLWSQNVLGRSQNYTSFDIPPQSEIAAPYVLVELNGDRAFVYVNLSSHTDVPLIVQWCDSVMDQAKKGLKICQDYASNTTFTLKADATKTFQTLTVNISENMESKRIQDYRLIKYYPIRRLNVLPETEQTANATVIMGVRNLTQEVESSDYYVEEKNPYDDDLYYDVNINNDGSRKRRYVREDGIYGQEKLFFISFWKERSQYNTGMIAANCYFDATKDKVDPIVSQSQDSDSDRIILRWSQECYTQAPMEFLADYFLVYSSTDEHCTNQVVIDRVNNILFQPNLLKISSDIQFVCIKTFRRDGLWTGPKAVSINNYNTGKDASLRIVGYVLGPIVGVGIIAGLLYFFLKRKQNVGKFSFNNLQLPTENTSNADTSKVICRSVSNVLEQTVSKDEISNSSSTDSGRGTDDDSKHVNISDRTNKDIRKSSTGSAVTHSCSNNISQCTSDVPGSSTGMVTSEVDCSTSYHEEKEKPDTDDLSFNGSSRSEESNTESRQQKAFEKKGFFFNANTNSDNSSSQISEVPRVHRHSDGSHSEQSGGNSERRVNSSNSCSGSFTEENCHSEGSYSEQSGGNSERRVTSGSSCSCSSGVRQENCNCDSEEENSSCSEEQHESDRESRQPQDDSPCSDSESRNFKPFDRHLSSGSESEGDIEKPLLHNSILCV